MAGSSARRARRLNALGEKTVDENATNETATNDEPGDGNGRAVRQPLNRTAARRPTAARPAAKRSKPAPREPATKQPATKQPAAKQPAPAATTDRPPLLTRMARAIDKRSDNPDEPASSLRMRGNETTFGYASAAILAIVPVVFLTVTTGPGAPPHPVTVAPAIGVVLALAMAASMRLSNRILTAFLAVTSSLATTATAVPTSVRPLSTVDLLAALGFALWITLRQSKARNAVLAERRKANQAVGNTPSRNAGGRGAGGRGAGAGGAGARPAGGRRGRKAAEAAEPTGPPPSARYTPPKNRS